MPIDKFVFDDQPEYLYFMVPQFTVESIEVKIRLRLIDGTENEWVAHTESSVNRYEIYCIPVGFQQLLIDQMTSFSLVDRWDVWVEDQNDTVISEVRTYYPIQDFFPGKAIFSV